MQIERGEHIYNFQFRLPAGLPSSFEGEFGHIRYIATVVLDIPRWPDDVFQQPFTVIKPLDLNDDPELRVIIHITFSLQSETIVQKNMCFFFSSLQNPVTVRENHLYHPCFLLCCLPSNPLSMLSQIPVGGYAPGQTINLSINVDNQSNTRVPKFTMELVQVSIKSND